MKRTNRKYINELSDYELAKMLVSCSESPVFDYDYDENLEFSHCEDVYTTSD